VITFDTVIDADSLMAAPADEMRAMGRAYAVHVDPNNPQKLRDAGGRFFLYCILPYLSTATRPN
jgi:hypothetical protein